MLIVGNSNSTKEESKSSPVFHSHSLDITITNTFLRVLEVFYAGKDI